MKLDQTLNAMGYESNWVVDDWEIILWERDEPQPTEAELIAAGWIKPTTEPEPTPEPVEETPTE